MNIIRLAVVVTWAALSASVIGQQANAKPQQEAMLAATRPTTEHSQLASLVGSWRREVTYTMGGGQSMGASGTATNRMILGGRFLQSEQVTAIPASPQMPAQSIEAVTIYGFDRRVSQFTIVEFDSMGTFSVSATGTRQPDGRIVMSGETIDDYGPTRRMKRYDMILRIVDADTYVTQIVFRFDNTAPLTIADTVHRRQR